MAPSMRKPNFGKPRSAVRTFSLSGHLPRLKTPLSAPPAAVSRPRPVVGRPGQSAAAAPQPVQMAKDACRRCGHGNGACTLTQIAVCTTATTGHCGGSCTPDVQQMLDELAVQRPLAAAAPAASAAAWWVRKN